MILYIVNAGFGWFDSFLLAHSGKAVCVGILAGYGPGLVMGVVASCTVVGGGAGRGVFLVTEDTRNHCDCHQWKK